MTFNDLVDINPQLPGFEHVGPEPSLWGIVFRYYREHFLEEKAEELTDRYFEALISHATAIVA